jgi:hypothetical protein
MRLKAKALIGYGQSVPADRLPKDEPGDGRRAMSPRSFSARATRSTAMEQAAVRREVFSFLGALGHALECCYWPLERNAFTCTSMSRAYFW